MEKVTFRDFKISEQCSCIVTNKIKQKLTMTAEVYTIKLHSTFHLHRRPKLNKFDSGKKLFQNHIRQWSNKKKFFQIVSISFHLHTIPGKQRFSSIVRSSHHTREWANKYRKSLLWLQHKRKVYKHIVQSHWDSIAFYYWIAKRKNCFYRPETSTIGFISCKKICVTFGTYPLC